MNWIDPEGTTRTPGQVLSNDALAGGGGGSAEGPPASSFSGRLGTELVPPRGTNCPAEIGGRSYSGHALDSMQGRGIVPSVVENTISNGVGISQPGGRVQLYDLGNNISVILNSNGKVITVFPGK